MMLLQSQALCIPSLVCAGILSFGLWSGLNGRIVHLCCRSPLLHLSLPLIPSLGHPWFLFSRDVNFLLSRPLGTLGGHKAAELVWISQTLPQHTLPGNRPLALASPYLLHYHESSLSEAFQGSSGEVYIPLSRSFLFEATLSFICIYCSYMCV